MAELDPNHRPQVPLGTVVCGVGVVHCIFFLVFPAKAGIYFCHGYRPSPV
jgi:hypothetical protein